MSVEDSPSPAELEFIERVRGDSARGRTLVRRALAAVAVSIAVIGAVGLFHGLPVSRAASDHFRPPGTWARTEAGPGSPTRVVAASRDSLNAPSDAEALEHRIARLEARLKALEHAAARGESLARRPGAAVAPTNPRDGARPAREPAATTPGIARRAMASPAPPAAAPAAPRPEASRPKSTAPLPGSRALEASAPRDQLTATTSTRASAVAPTPHAGRPQPQEETLSEHVRRGWASIERGVRRAPQDFREGMNRITRLFAD